MKKLILSFALLAGAVAQVQAEEITVTGTVGYETKYIFRGVALADDFFSPAVDVSVGDFYAGAWAALPIDSMFDEEVDLYAGMNNSLSETTTLDVGVTLYTYPGSDADSTVEFYSGLSWDLPLSPSFYVFYDIDLDTLTTEFSFGKTVEINDTSAWEWGIHTGYVMPDVGDSLLYGGVSAAYTLTISENVSASIGANYYGASENITADSKHEFTIAASITTGF
ncbi:MAG: TorF family putative porin [Puniceicoccaceae bacterium]